jgi:Predicted integral membrane protein
MTSIISGFEYDIFISYRQKDNKGDRWVSKFVDALKIELEATFKDDISVYFDENPHDRLQETHNVDKSLEGKLKCLIFIPILSQTYCDQNSYAWQYEFLAFNKLAKEDRVGRDIKLRNGNYASRILPIRIHDLEQEDVKLFEKETGSILRAMDFVFKTSSGVNRPLKANEDHPNDNLNKTFYTDQINKTANAIKEIISGLKIEATTLAKEKTLHKEILEEIKKEERKNEHAILTKLTKPKLLSGSIIIAIVIVIVLFYPRIFNRDKFKNLKDKSGRISIAVMPFRNMTNDSIWNVWQGGIQNELINNLTNSEELKVRGIESISGLLKNKGLTNYASITPSIASTISKKLDANVLIYGSIKQAGTTLRVNVQLIDSKTEEAFKSFQIDGASENILHIIDSLSVMVKNFLIISILEKDVTLDTRHILYTSSAEAYRYFIDGNNAYWIGDFPTSIKLFSQAIAIDSTFTLATLMISMAYGNQSLYDQAKKWCLKAYKKRDQMLMQYKILINWVYALNFENPYEEIKYLKQLQEYDDQLPFVYWQSGEDYNSLHQYDKAIPEFETALKIYNKWGSKPSWVYNYTMLGYAYHKTGQYKKEKSLYNKAEQDFPDNSTLIYWQAVLSLTEGDTIGANKYIEKYISVCKDNSDPEANIITNLASVYSESGILNKADEYYRKALSLEPEKPNRLNNLAYFQIDKNRNINEGLKLIDKALVLSPDDYNLVHTKGWGLYKQGKYQEALDVLQKSWDLRREKAIYDHEAFLHLEAAKKAVANQK